MLGYRWELLVATRIRLFDDGGAFLCLLDLLLGVPLTLVHPRDLYQRQALAVEPAVGGEERRPPVRELDGGVTAKRDLQAAEVDHPRRPAQHSLDGDDRIELGDIDKGQRRRAPLSDLSGEDER